MFNIAPCGMFRIRYPENTRSESITITQVLSEEAGDLPMQEVSMEVNASMCCISAQCGFTIRVSLRSLPDVKSKCQMGHPGHFPLDSR